MNQFFFRIVVPVAVLCSLSCTAWGGSLEKKVAPAPLVEVKTDVPGLIVAMQYATADNFTGKVLYDCNRCFLTETTGCTAMAEKELVEILHWLKAEENPVLVQLPLPIYKRFWKGWQLPAPEMLVEPSEGK